MTRVSVDELHREFNTLAKYLPGIKLDSRQPSPDCYVRYRIVRRGRVLLGKSWWFGRAEAYLSIQLALDAIRAYVLAQKA